ncbi:hypothetical protein ACFYWP_42005 [Actinacidiphila glaucinigra]|uniref:hypothetical protein n=1 Tax=Actinacidiphila glaucinigra TaxID=235986 RepID=UPI0036B1AA5C
MYDMRAEPMASETGSARLWHVLRLDGSALCGRELTARPVAASDDDCRDEYCTPCMTAVAAAAARRGGLRPMT